MRVFESEWADMCVLAESRDYIERIIDKREIRSFIISLKQHACSADPLTVHNA